MLVWQNKPAKVSVNEQENNHTLDSHPKLAEGALRLQGKLSITLYDKVVAAISRGKS